LRQAEDVERASGATVATGVVCCGVLTDLRVARGTRGDHRDVLTPVGSHVADRRAAEVTACAERPQDAAVPGVDGAELTGVRPTEDEVAPRRHHGLVVLADSCLEAPDLLVRDRVPRLELAAPAAWAVADVVEAHQE